MTLDRLEVFLRIVEAGSMGAASRVLHLTQPALSHSLRLLEEELATQLFDRRGRKLVLTAAGRALVPRARMLIESKAEIVRDLNRATAQGYYDLRIGAIDSVATYLFPNVVGLIEKAFPGLAIKLTTARTPELLRRVAAADLDAVIVAHPGRPQLGSSCDVLKVGTYPLGFYGKKSRFPTLGRATTEEEVAQFPIVELEPMAGQGTLIRKDAATFAVTHSLSSVKALVLAGFGVGALLDFMLTPAEKKQLVRANLPHDPDCLLFVVAAKSSGQGSERRLHTVLAEVLKGALKTSSQ